MNQADNTQYMDSLLLQALRQDDEKALSYLFSNYYNKLYRTGIRWCLDNHLTEESIQEVFQDLWQYRHTLGEIISFEAYLKASLKKRIARKAKNSDSETDESIENFPLPTESYEDILIKQEDSEIRKTQLSKALEELTPRQKEIIVLKYFEELSYKEISDKTGLQVDTIYKVLHEGIKRLKGLLTSN
ncbi:MAG: RNA polymerase sigma factor [Spirosomataceae bacterium]